MIKFFKPIIPKYFTSHSKPERLSKYIAKEKRLDRMKSKKISQTKIKFKTKLKGGIENYEKHNWR